jgi:hypothetical protein
MAVIASVVEILVQSLLSVIFMWNKFTQSPYGLAETLQSAHGPMGECKLLWYSYLCIDVP